MSEVSARVARQRREHRAAMKSAASKKRREAALADGRCINENRLKDHGLATHGVRCQRCWLVYLYGIDRASQMEAWISFVPKQP